MSSKNFLKYITLGVYLLILAWLILFKFSSPAAVLFTHRGVNLIPFNISEDSSVALQMKEIVYNAVVFVPLGVYLSMLWRNLSLWKKALAAMLLSLGFEIVQLIFALGISDVTDLITNTSGALCGVIVYKLLFAVFKEKTDKAVSITALIFEICFGVLFAALAVANM